MKTTHTLLSAAVLSIGLFSATGANASLIGVLSGQAVNDPGLNIMWAADANLAASNTFGLATGVNLGTDINGYQSIINSNGSGMMTWGGAQKWIGAMNAANYLGYNDWRLPTSDTCSGYNCTGSEMGHLFYELGGAAGSSILSTHNDNLSLFQNVQSSQYWSGTELAPSPNHAWYFSTYDGYQYADYKVYGRFAFAVRTGQVIIPPIIINFPPNPVPIPAAAWLLGSGLLGLVGMARRKAA